MFQKLYYKGYIIHIFTYKFQELIEVQINGIRTKVKSYRAAQLAITKHIKNRSATGW